MAQKHRYASTARPEFLTNARRPNDRYQGRGTDEPSGSPGYPVTTLNTG